MLGGVPQILWGTNFESVIQFGYPLDSIVAGRKPRAGSEYVQSASGVEDAWITGFDYEMTASFRWIPDVTTTNPPATAWSGSTGVQAFLDYARAKNTFRFVPDGTNPLFYVDGCYVSDPMDTHGSLESDGTRNLQLTIRNPTVDFHAALRGIMFEYAPGASLTDPVAATFTRATAATRRGLPGTLAAAVGASDASGVLRDRHYEGTTRTTLLEAARTQLVTDPENFGNWGTVGTVARTAGQADPFGGTAAYIIDSNTPAATDRIVEVVTFTADGTKAIAVFAKQGTSGQSDILLQDSTAGVERFHVRLTWTAGVPAAAVNNGSGTIFSVENWGAGWYRVLLAVNSVVAANVNNFILYPDPTGGGGTTLYFGANAWNATFPSSYQGPSLGTRNDDVLTWPFPYKPQAMFGYTKFVERGTVKMPDVRALWNIGVRGSNSFYVDNTFGGALYRAVHQEGTAVSAILGAAPAIGDTVELLAILRSDGSVELHQSINGAAETVTSLSAALALPAAWTNATLTLDAFDAGSLGVGLNAFIQQKIGLFSFGGQTVNTIALARSA